MQDPDTDNWFSSQVQIHEPKLRSYLRRKFPTLNEEDDVVQESYSKLLKFKESGKIDNSQAFLFTTARNAVIDLFRKRRTAKTDSVADFSELGVLDNRPDVADEAIKKEELDMMTDALLALPHRCRQTMTLRVVYQMSHKDIARQLSVSPHTVKAQLAKGMKRCTEYFEKRK